MQRIYTNDGSSEIRGYIDQLAQIRKVANSPVIGSLQRVELGSDPPNLAAGLERRGR